MAGGVGGRGEPGGVGRCQGTKGRGAGQGHRILRGVRGSSLSDPGGKKSRVDGLGPRLPGKAQSASAGHACPWGLGLSRDMAVLLQPWEGTGRAAFCLQVGPPTPTLARPRPEHSPPAPRPLPTMGRRAMGRAPREQVLGLRSGMDSCSGTERPRRPASPSGEGGVWHRGAPPRGRPEPGGRPDRVGATSSTASASLRILDGEGRGGGGPHGHAPGPVSVPYPAPFPSPSALASCPRKAAVSVLTVLQLKGGSVRHPELSL